MLQRLTCVLCNDLRSVLVLAILGLAVLYRAPQVLAQKVPQPGYVYPPVVSVGKVTQVSVGGYDLTDDVRWTVHHPAVRMTVLSGPGDYQITPPPYWEGPRAGLPSPPIPREVNAQIEVDANAAEGFVAWQTANANGASRTALFYLSRQNEVLESRSRDLPQELPAIPVAVSGRLSRLTEVDRYRVSAAETGPISVRLMARPFGSDLHGVLQVHDESGRTIADWADTEGRDGEITFTAQQGQAYVVSLHDVDFRGDRGYVYRLAFRSGPRVVAMLPASIQRGTRQTMLFAVAGLDEHSDQVTWVSDGIEVPPDEQDGLRVHQLKTPVGVALAKVPISDVAELVLSDSASRVRSQAQTAAGDSLWQDGTFPTFQRADEAAGSAGLPADAPLHGPVAVTATIQRGVMEVRLPWRVQTNQFWTLQLQSVGIGGDLDMELTVLKPDGTVWASNDQAESGRATTDAELELATGDTDSSEPCTIVVRSLSEPLENGRNVFRLQIAESRPDFQLMASGPVRLPVGEQVEIPVTVTRRGGFDGPIAVVAEGLPDGVTAIGDWTIGAGQTKGSLELQCSENAAADAAVLRMQGTAIIGERAEQRPVLTPVPAIPLTEHRSGWTDQLMLAVTMPAPFDIQVVDRERQRDVPRGTTYLAELKIVRQPGFEGPLSIEMTAQQDRQRMGVRGPILHVGADESTVWYPVFLPEWLSTDLTRRIVVHGVGGVKDSTGATRWLTRAADARITMIMEGALLKLSADQTELTAERDSVVEVPLRVLRSSTLALPACVQLEVPEEIAGLVWAEPLTLAPDQEMGRLQVHVEGQSVPDGFWTLTMKATALQDGKWPVVSQTDVRLEIGGGALVRARPIP